MVCYLTKKWAKKNRPVKARANRGGKQGEKQKVQIQGALTPGSIKFKRVVAAIVRAKIAALEEASNTSSLTNDTRKINTGILVSAIMSLSGAAAKKDNATIAIIASETATDQVLDKNDDLKVAELQLRGILRNANKWNNNFQPVQYGEDFKPNDRVISVILSGVAHGANNNKLSTT